MVDAFGKIGIVADKDKISTLLNEIDDDNSGELDCLEFSVMLHKLSTGERLVGKSSANNDTSEEDQKDVQPPTRFGLFREAVWSVVGDSADTVLGRISTTFIMSMIFLSCTMFIAETLPQVRGEE
jgi:hypothetical protein